MRRYVASIALVAVAACGGTATTTEPTTELTPEGPAVTDPGASAATAITDLRTEMAAFAGEVQAAASVELAQAWENLDAELADLAVMAETTDLSQIDLTPAREAVDEVTIAVEQDQEQISEAFQNFWTNFTTRFGSVLTAS